MKLQGSLLHGLGSGTPYIFRYFGLGCRNVSKIYLPASYDFDPFFNAMFTWKQVIDHHKYMNNYDYNKAVYLMSDIPLLDNEFMLLKEDTDFASPISVVHYEYYDSIETLEQELQNQQQEIQCIVGHLEGHDPIPLPHVMSWGHETYLQPPLGAGLASNLSSFVPSRCSLPAC